jgi:hypothetical protein
LIIKILIKLILIFILFYFILQILKTKTIFQYECISRDNINNKKLNILRDILINAMIKKFKAIVLVWKIISIIFLF